MNSSGLQEFYLESVLRNSLDINGKLNWELVFQRIEERDITSPHDQEEIEKIADVLLDALLTSGCDDGNVVVRYFEFYARYLEAAWWMRDDFMNDIIGPDSRFGTSWTKLWIMIPNEQDHMRYILLPMQGGASNRYVFLWPPGENPDHEREGQNIKVAETEIIVLNSGNWKFLSALVRYGHWKGAMNIDENCSGWDFKDVWLIIQRYNVKSHGMSYRDVYPKGLETWNKLQSEHGRGFQRLPLVIRTLKAVLLKSEDNPEAEQYMKCLKLYFTTLSHPMVSADEVREFLIHLMRGEDCPQVVVDRIVDRWINVFGEESYRPRSLMHLCRCAMRNALAERKSSVLPCLVEDLPIPDTLKDFLLGAPE